MKEVFVHFQGVSLPGYSIYNHLFIKRTFAASCRGLASGMSNTNVGGAMLLMVDVRGSDIPN